MDRQALRRAIKEKGDFLNIQQIADFLGMDRDIVKRDFLQGLEYIPTGKSKLYFREDLIEVIMDKKRADL